MNVYNNTVSWYFGYDVQPVVVQSQGRDYLSNLPADILKVIMNDLPNNSVRALHLTERKIMSAAEAILSLRHQEFLETIIYEVEKMFNRPYHHDFSIKNLENHKRLTEEAKTFQNGSAEKLQTLRNAICSLYRGIDLDDLLSLSCRFSLTGEEIAKNKLLMAQLMTNVDYGMCQRAFLRFNDRQKIRLVNQYFNLLETNQTSPKKFEMEVFSIPFHESSLKSFLGVLRESHSISEVTLTGFDWDLLHVKAILEVINNNERIMEFKIRDIGSLRNANEDDWFCVKNQKTKLNIEFEELIDKELKDSFEFIKRDEYGQLIYKRIS